jgi:hypothetical protein
MKTIKKNQLEALKKFLIKDGWQLSNNLDHWQVVRATKLAYSTGKPKLFVINDGPNADSDCYYVPQFSDPIVDSFQKHLRESARQ